MRWSALAEFVPCSTCSIDRLASTLDEKGQCPFCIEEGVAPPAPEPRTSKIIVVPSKNTGARTKNTSEESPIPRAVRAEDQQVVDEAYTMPYVAPAFDHRRAEADPARELAMRALCRRRLLPFVQRFRPKYLAGWVHEDICRRLERFVKAVEAGESPRLLLLLPPRSGKSELGSRNFPPWVLGQHPDWEIIAASHTQSLTLSFSRYVRDLVRDPAYKAIYPDLILDPASQSIENWNTLQGGGYMAAGVGTGISGRGCHILVVDDVVKDAEAADSVTIRENTWEWYISTAYTRLAPGGGVLGILCMTGDTPVLMADGAQRRLDTLSVSDEIATFDRGRLGTSTIKGLRSNGHDSVLKITTISGKIVRANERHPFLTVDATGELGWTRTRSLTTAHRIVTVKDNGVSGKALLALPKVVTNKLFAEGTASRTTPRSGGLTGIDLPLTVSHHAATPGSSIAMESLPQTMKLSMRVRAAVAPSVENQQMQETPPVTGSTNSPSTTVTTRVRCEDCCATTATQGLDTLGLSQWHLPQPGIFDFTLNEIVSIEPAGVEEVFDLQVERTENFIANGLVSHNTWWHEDDWAGRIQEVMKSGEGDVFEVVKYPAINEEGDEYILPDDTIQQFSLESDPPPEGSRLTRLRGTAIHPDRYTTAMMLKIKNNLISSGLKRVWNALYQQNPVPDDGVYFTKEMLRWYTHPPRREDMFVYQAWDFAITEKTDSDWTVCATVGQDEQDNLYLLHILRFRSGDGNAIVDDILDQYELFKPDLIGFEDGQIWKSLASQFKKRCDERRLYPNSELLQPLTDKKVRAGPLKGRMQNGKLFVRQNQPWTEAFRQEFMKFPSGKYDDQVDATAWAVRLTLTKAAPKKRVPKAEKSWKDKLNGLIGVDRGGHMAA